MNYKIPETIYYIKSERIYTTYDGYYVRVNNGICGRCYDRDYFLEGIKSGELILIGVV